MDEKRSETLWDISLRAFINIGMKLYMGSAAAFRAGGVAHDINNNKHVIEPAVNNKTKIDNNE